MPKLKHTLMKRYLLIIPITIALTIFFYPTISNSLPTGSPGGKTGSPTDGASCMGCHTDAQQGQGATITTNIPSTGYEPGDTYNITAALNGSVPQNISGFEITCEENATNTKTGSFGITNPTSTQFTNNSNAVTHTAAGNSQNTWSFNWVAPTTGTGDITFYGAFIEAGYPIPSNMGDFFAEATLSFNEATVNSTINLSNNSISFNPITKTIECLDKGEVSVYSLEGKLVLYSNKRYTNLAHLSKGIYILKSENKTQKITLN